MFGSFGLFGGAGVGVAAEQVGIVAATTGVVAQLTRVLAGSTFTRVSGTPTISTTGAISLAAGLAAGNSIVIVVREAVGTLAAEYPVTLLAAGAAAAGGGYDFSTADGSIFL